MLAKPTKAIGEVLDKFENTKFTCEYKYDGERAQVSLTGEQNTKRELTGFPKPRCIGSKTVLLPCSVVTPRT
jgi:DNA ligase-1